MPVVGTCTAGQTVGQAFLFYNAAVNQYHSLNFITAATIVVTHLCHFTGHEWWYHGSVYIIYTFAMTYIYTCSNKY